MFYKKELLEYRRNLRKNSTPAEKKLWARLRNRRFNNLKFRRQVSIGYYIVDFYICEFKLAIELDGGHHYTPEVMEYDKKRTEFLNSIGIRVIRFPNREVMCNIDGVLREIARYCHHPDATRHPS